MNSNSFNFCWGDGLSDLFLDVLDNGRLTVLNMEFDHEEICRRCGGNVYYTSCSGLSGAARLNSLDTLMPVGAWRTDTIRSAEFKLVSLGQTPRGYEVLAALPYANHKDVEPLLGRYPVVIRVRGEVIYCDFQDFLEIVGKLLSDGELPEGKYRELCHIFTESDGEEWEERFDFYDFSTSDSRNKPDPWMFLRKELEPYSLYDVVWHHGERIYELLSVKKDYKTGAFYRVNKLGGRPYRCGKVQDPLKEGPLTAGWKRLADDALVRFYEREAHLVVYIPARSSLTEQAQQLAAELGEDEKFADSIMKVVMEQPVNWADYQVNEREYKMCEQVVPKALYLLDKETLLGELRKEVARKVRNEVLSAVYELYREMNKEVPADLA